MDSISNKDKIFFTTIRLIAEKGYSNVSMREIAKEVEIKAASIYNHYSSKEAILDAIVDYFKEQLQAEVYPFYSTSEEIGTRSFIRQMLESSDRFFANPKIVDISKIIFREQFHNEKIRHLLLEELIQKPRKVYAENFEKLMQRGHVRTLNPELMAIEFHSFFIYCFYENSLAIEYSQIDFEKIRKIQNEHVELFLKNYCLE